MGAIVKVVELDPAEGAGAMVTVEVEAVGSEKGAFLVKKGAGEGDVEDGVHIS